MNLCAYVCVNMKTMNTVTISIEKYDKYKALERVVDGDMVVIRSEYGTSYINETDANHALIEANKYLAKKNSELEKDLEKRKLGNLICRIFKIK